MHLNVLSQKHIIIVIPIGAYYTTIDQPSSLSRRELLKSAINDVRIYIYLRNTRQRRLIRNSFVRRACAYKPIVL